MSTPTAGVDATLRHAAAPFTLPAAWWDLVDRVQHVVLTGPGDAALMQAADAGTLVAMAGRARLL